ncbi:MAG TPA: mechanosensitive ion channel family protein [Capillimicrobium sp.]|nr:mechanosensitive ion channel family protein [Capillimicrobium sp.]
MPRERMRKMLETRSHSWEEVGLARQLSRGAVKRARIETLVVLLAIVAVGVLYSYRRELVGPDWAPAVRWATVIVLLILGWSFARGVGRSLGPVLFRRMDPATAGTIGFLIRLATIILALVVALRIAGVSARQITVGGAFTAVIVGLAAQQTLGNLFAGLVLLSARPFRVGERVRLQGAGIQVDGIVSQLGLLYTVFADGEDEIMVPNSVVLNVSVSPLREPDAVDMRARLRPGVTPADIQKMLDDELDVPMIDRPRIVLEELDGQEVVVRITATPIASNDGPRLATEILNVVSRETPGGEADLRANANANGHGDGDARGTAKPAGPAGESRG